MQNKIFPVLGTARPNKTLEALAHDMQMLVRSLQREPSDAHAGALMSLVADYRLTLSLKVDALQQGAKRFPPARRAAYALSPEQERAQQLSRQQGILSCVPDHSFEVGSEAVPGLDD